jgi:hypothetical protein
VRTFSEVLDLSWLEAYATAYRYPRTKGGVTDAPPPARLDAALAQIGAVLSAVAEYFAVDLDLRADTPADHGRPPRTGGTPTPRATK